MLIGFVSEGWDYLILQAYMARLWQIPETEIQSDPIGGAGHGWRTIVETLPTALRRFYAICAVMAVVEIDNDGEIDVLTSGLPEDPQRPRHWRHAVGASLPSCRWCQLKQIADNTRPLLRWLPDKAAENWPIVIAVPVEAIESWLLISRAIKEPGAGSLNAERESRQNQKLKFYGRPAASKQDVQDIALPLIRAMSPENLLTLCQYSSSFEQFAMQCGAAGPAV